MLVFRQYIPYGKAKLNEWTSLHLPKIFLPQYQKVKQFIQNYIPIHCQDNCFKCFILVITDIESSTFYSNQPVVICFGGVKCMFKQYSFCVALSCLFIFQSKIINDLKHWFIRNHFLEFDFFMKKFKWDLYTQFSDLFLIMLDQITCSSSLTGLSNQQV